MDRRNFISSLFAGAAVASIPIAVVKAAGATAKPHTDWVMGWDYAREPDTTIWTIRWADGQLIRHHADKLTITPEMMGAVITVRQTL